MRRKFNGVTRRLSKVTRNKTTASVFLFLSYAWPRTVSRSSPFPPESAFPCRCLEGRIVNQKPRGSPENSRRKREEKRVSHGDKGERVGGWRASRRRKWRCRGINHGRCKLKWLPAFATLHLPLFLVAASRPASFHQTYRAARPGFLEASTVW